MHTQNTSAINRRDRQRDKRTDIVPLHKSSLLEAAVSLTARIVHMHIMPTWLFCVYINIFQICCAGCGVLKKVKTYNM